MGNPLRGLLHGAGFQRAADDTAFFGAGNQAGGFQYREMLHEAGQRHRVLLRQFADGVAALFQLRQHAPPCAIGQRGEHQIELLIIMLNHVVKYSPAARLCQAPGLR